MHAAAHYSMLCKAYICHFIYGEFLKKKKSMLCLVQCLDCPVSDYACTIHQAALLQKSDIILRTEPGPAAPQYVCADTTHFNKVPRKLILQFILTDKHR